VRFKKPIILLCTMACLVWATYLGILLFKKPARVAAIGDTIDLSPEMQRALDPDDFRPLLTGESYWLAAHPEPGQTFEQFKNAGFERRNDKRNRIYLQPLSSFEEGISPPLEDLRECTGAFFGIETRVLKAIQLEEIEITSSEIIGRKRLQYLTKDILEWLSKRIPDDCFCLVAVTM